MFARALLLAMAAISTLTAAQNYSAPGSGNLSIDLTQIPAANRTQWCASQMGVCPLICGGQAFPNTCQADDVLGFQCVCTDGSSPNISDYVGTIPNFICQIWRANCIAANVRNEANQQACLSVVCGMMDPRDNVANTTATASSSSSTSSPTGSASSDGSPSATTGSAPAETTSGAATALLVGQSYGTGILATGLLGLFAFVL